MYIWLESLKYFGTIAIATEFPPKTRWRWVNTILDFIKYWVYAGNFQILLITLFIDDQASQYSIIVQRVDNNFCLVQLRDHFESDLKYMKEYLLKID